MAQAIDGTGLRILLLSAWDTVNIGDIGHTPGTLRVLEQYLPGATVTLGAARLNEAVEGMLRRRFPKVRILAGAAAAGGLKIQTPAEALERAAGEVDLVIHNSSMAWGLEVLRFCRDQRKPLVLFGQSYFPDFVRQPEAVELLKSTALVFCRDGLTLQTLQQAGVAAEFNPDGCFGIDVRDEARAEAFMQERGLEARRFITVQLRTNTQKHPGTDSFLNPANPTPQQQADDQRRAAIFRQIITAWVERTGAKVLIAPEVQKEIAHNKRLLMDPLPETIRRQVVLRDTFWNVDEAASVFARAHTVVCHEPHSCIIALANGTPILHTYSPFHSPKYHMFADIGLKEWLPPLDDTPPAQIIERLMAIDADYPAAQAKVAQAMAFVHQRFAAACGAIARVGERP